MDAVVSLLFSFAFLGGMGLLVAFAVRSPPSRPRLSPALEARVAAMLRKRGVDADVNLNAVATSIRLHGASGHDEMLVALLGRDTEAADAVARLAQHGTPHVDDDDLVIPIDRETAIRWTPRDIARFVDDVVALAAAFTRVARSLPRAKRAGDLEAGGAPSGAPFAVPIERIRRP